MPTVALLETADLPTAAPPPHDNVVQLRALFLPRHQESLDRWLAAGAPMGISDAEVAAPYGRAPRSGPMVVEHVLIWVRESADPAYMIRPRGLRWSVIDHQRDYELCHHSSFEAALNAIRPVLPQPGVAA